MIPTSVRELIKSVSKIARHLKVSKSAIYRWITVDRIPGERLMEIAAYYKHTPRDLIHLTGSEKTNDARVIAKSRNVLATLMEVYRGQKTLEEALEETGMSRISLALIQKRWGDRLPTLYTTLEQLDQGRINLVEASNRLNVTKSTLHGIRGKYGYRPGHLQAKGKPARAKESAELRVQRAEASLAAAFDCIAGKTTIQEAALAAGVCDRTVMRTIAKVSAVGVGVLNQVDDDVRDAYLADLLAANGKQVEYTNLNAMPRHKTAYLLSQLKG